MKTWNIEIATQTRWLPCGDIEAASFDEALAAAYAMAKRLKARGELFSGGVSSRLVRA